MNANQAIGAAVFLGIIAAIAFFLWKFRGGDSTMSRARKYARDWWQKEMNGEELSREEEHAFRDSFGPEKMFGFVFKRAHGSLPVVIVVEAGRSGQMDIVDYSADPPAEMQNDPFMRLAKEFLRSPVPLLEPIPRYRKWMGDAKNAGTGVQVNVNKEKEEEAAAKK